MTKQYYVFLKLLRKIFSKFINHQKKLQPKHFEDYQQFVSDLIGQKIKENKPFMLSRLGGTELWAITNFVGYNSNYKNVFNYIINKQEQWWWDEKMFNQMSQCAGFFPSNADSIIKFSKLYISCLNLIDIFGWYSDRLSLLNKFYTKTILKVSPVCLEPHGLKNPWTKALRNKKVLVVHPFTDTIKSQYIKRELLFNDPKFLPKFHLKTVRAVQSLGGVNSDFNNWFEALDYMKSEIDKKDYDICLIGCGAYGLPLAAHVKSRGKQAIHIGGSLQLIFGIKGKRWDNDNLYNEFWVRPNEDETPVVANKIEDGCYW